MPDLIDEIQERDAYFQAMFERRLGILSAKQKTGVLAPVRCLNCDASLSALSLERWCDLDCREDWEHRNRRIRQ